MTIEEAKKKLAAEGQEQVLAFWKKLSAKERTALLAQIARIDFKALARMKAMLKAAPERAKKQAAPMPAPVVEWKPKTYAAAQARGERELAAGRVAVLLVAGGQGSRLGFDGPKGAYPIGPLTDAPLFHFHARKILALQLRYGARIPFYVMTSEVNHAATVKCFADADYFGLDKKDVVFFTQGMWPALDAGGKIMLDAPGHIFMSPDGHGGVLSALDRTGCLKDMKKRGIRSVFFFQVDNPMVEIADPAFIGLHVAEKADISLKLCAKRDPYEGLGVVVKRGKTFSMIEYSELSDAQATKRRANGELYFKYGSVAIHVFSLAFMVKEAKWAMPLHIAHKKIPVVDAKGKVVKPEKPNGCKFEKFIFDVLPDAKKVINLAFDRAEEFSPVKNAEGNDSPATCKRDLQAKWRRWMGAPADADFPVEIDPVYARCAEDLQEMGVWL